MIGILGTVLVQSSSTFTSIIVAAIGGGLPIRDAVPMLMGMYVNLLPILVKLKKVFTFGTSIFLTRNLSSQ